MIKAFIFDLGGVLFTNGTKKFIELVSSRYNLPKEKVENVIDGDLATLYRESKISRDEFWQRLVKDLALTEDIDRLEEEWINGYEVIEGTKELIQKLSQKYTVSFLSDNVKERIDAIDKKHGFLSWFEGGVFSHEAGVRKPDPQIYKIVLERAHVSPEEAVFIDDKPTFLIPAKEMGMTTFLFESPEKLREDLIRYNLLH